MNDWISEEISTFELQKIITPLNTLSIIIAIYNRKDELTELLSSLSIQTEKEFEVIVVDDGSMVDLSPVVADFQEKLNLKYFRKTNSGPGLSRNYGAQHAQNSWLVFVDSDVIVESDYVENIRKNLLTTDCAAFGGADKAHEGFNTLQKAISYSMTSVLTTGGIRGNKKAVTRFQPRSFNMGVKKDIFLSIGGFSEMRIGEDPDLSMTIWEAGYKTAFFDNIGVYHKRRTDLGKFSKQVYQFGCARPILNLRHPKFVKPSFWFPTVFLIGYIIGILQYFTLQNGLMLSLYGLYTFIVFFHATITTKSLAIAAQAIITTHVQMFSYGYGFLESWIKLNILSMTPEKAFPHHFHQR